MRHIILIPVLLMSAIFASSEVFACSFVPGYKVVKPQASYAISQESVPPLPSISVAAVRRGFDDGSPGSCSDAGILTFVVEDRPHPDVAGYTFEVIKGAFPDEVFPSAVFEPVDLGDGRKGFRFAWLDLPPGRNKPESIDATVEVRLISNAGKEGPPMLLHILNEG